MFSSFFLLACCFLSFFFLPSKELQCSSSILVHPQFDREFILQTDASHYGLGAVLSQVDDNGFEKVIAFASRTLSDRERKYSTTEKEPLVYVMNHFRIYLLGRKFTVITDHNTLRWLHSMEPKGSLARWVMDPFRNFNSQSDIGLACAASELNPGIVRGLVRMWRRLTLGRPFTFKC